jgi:putative MATE family efflux protein
LSEKKVNEQDLELGQNFTFGSLLRFVAPSIFTFVFIALYQLVDGMFIERYVGEMAISATNLFYPLLGLFVATGIMLGSGGNALVVRLVGEGKPQEASRVFSGLLELTLILGVLSVIVTLLFKEPIMRFCGATDGNIGYLRDYYVIMCAFAPAIILQSMLGITIIGEGKAVVAAVVIMIGGILNCVLDYVFMAKLKMGIFGAGLATVIGYFSTIVYAVWFYLEARKSSYRLHLVPIDMRAMGQICFNGSSDMISNLAGGITALFMNHLAYRYYGEIGVSALSVWSYLTFMIMAVFMGFTSAVEPVLSYHYGSGNIPMRRRVFRLSIRWCLIIGFLLMILLYLFRNAAIELFFDPGSEYFKIAYRGYIIALPACLMVGINIFGSGVFTAFSNGVVSALLSAARTFLILTACLYGMTALFGGLGLWSAWPTTEALSLVMTALFLHHYQPRYQY